MSSIVCCLLINVKYACNLFRSLNLYIRIYILYPYIASLYPLGDEDLPKTPSTPDRVRTVCVELVSGLSCVYSVHFKQHALFV